MLSRWIERSLCLFFMIPLCAAAAWADERAQIMVGAARIEVTPTAPVVLAGYGGRSKPFEGIDGKLWARALVIGGDEPKAIVVLDNCGVPGSVTARLAARLTARGISKDRLVVAATHTHNAPTLVDYAPIVWRGRTTAAEDLATAQYTAFAVEQMEKAVVQALSNRRPMTLEWAQGRVAFGGNRRVLGGGRWRGFGLQRDGPVDHSLPVLAARDDKGKVRAVWANYACHCTTVGSRNSIGGDWAGFANQWMEKKFPGAVSLMTIGCGADIGPQPSGSLALAEQHGRSIAEEVQRLLGAGKSTALTVAPTVSSKQIKLPLEEPRGRDYWETRAQTESGFHRELARSMLERIEKQGPLARHVDYTISLWSFGDDLAMIFLGGEVVVDYSLRLNRELDWRRVWITAWANDMPGYIPSRRVLLEGGYEPDFSQVYYNHPGRYALGIEELIVGAVKELAGQRFAPQDGVGAAPFHQLPKDFGRIPGGQQRAFERLAKWIAGQQAENASIAALQRLLPIAQTALHEGQAAGGALDQWYDFAGDRVERRFIRQESRSAELRWAGPALKNESRSGPAVLCFSGGVGWESQAKTEGFGLYLDGRQRLVFDVTREFTRWKSSDEEVELFYLPTWTSDVDSGGFFVIVLHKPPNRDRGRIAFAVRSLGEGSKRWFAIDTDQDDPARLNKLKAAVKAVHKESK